MPRAHLVHRQGGPEVLQWEEVEVKAPADGEVCLKQTAVGVNYIDVYQRSGLYPLKTPFIPGQEGAGIVTAVGPGVTNVAKGDRVAYCSLMGAYAEERLAPAERVVKLPQGISDEEGAAMMLKGLTAEYLLRRTTQVKPGDTIVIHAAAGGVGLIATQWAKLLGATVIGTVGSERKAEVARAHGCDHVVVTTREDFVKRVREITSGKGVPVVYDSVGKDTLLGSLDCLRTRGLLVFFGQSSGKPDPLDLGSLAPRGSLYVTRPTLHTYLASTDELRAASAALFEVVKSGKVKINVNQKYALQDAAQAHRDLEARKTTGSTVLLS